MNVVDNPFEEIFSPSQMIQEDNVFNNRITAAIIFKMKFSTKFCNTHICQVQGCHFGIRNDKTPWCVTHSTPCQYIESDGQQCIHFYWKDNQPDNTYCDEHQCHWNPLMCNDKRCLNHVSIKDSSGDYCESHYQQYLFHKYEYYS